MKAGSEKLLVFSRAELLGMFTFTDKMSQKSSLQLICDPVSTKPVISSTGIFVAIANNTLYGSKLLDFSFMPKVIRILRSCSMKIFSKFPTVNISKLNF